MKTIGIFCALMMFILLNGCDYSSTKVRARVVEHALDPSGKHYALLYQILEPEKLAGKYGIGATKRTDLMETVDGTEYYVFLNFTMIGPLSSSKPLSGYLVSAPRSKTGDFLEMAQRVK